MAGMSEDALHTQTQKLEHRAVLTNGRPAAKILLRKAFADTALAA
jgi:hypothetical protein